MKKNSIEQNDTTNYQERIVAFVDILGFSAMIAKSEGRGRIMV